MIMGRYRIKEVLMEDGGRFFIPQKRDEEHLSEEAWIDMTDRKLTFMDDAKGVITEDMNMEDSKRVKDTIIHEYPKKNDGAFMRTFTIPADFWKQYNSIEYEDLTGTTFVLWEDDYKEKRFAGWDCHFTVRIEDKRCTLWFFQCHSELSEKLMRVRPTLVRKNGECVSAYSDILMALMEFYDPSYLMEEVKEQLFGK